MDDNSNTFNDIDDPRALLCVQNIDHQTGCCVYTPLSVSNNQAIPCIKALSKNNEQHLCADKTILQTKAHERVPDRA